MSITSGKILAYFALPGFVPRLKRIFGTGFSSLSYYMASVLNVARLLPNNHPYLNPANVGRYGMHHVLLQAWGNLEFKKKNTDQVIIFFSLLTGIVLLFAQMILFVLAFTVPEASADFGDELTRMFVTQKPDQDLAFMFLDRVFGIPNIFNSSVTADDGWPTPLHLGIQAMFGYYNTGLAIVAFLIILYFVIALVGETAKTGVPFGKRFNGAMAPLRLVVALALLVPITNGMNSAQMITLYAAKYGSGLATNGWIVFLDKIKTTFILGDANTLVVSPTPPQANGLVEFMFVAMVCRSAYELSTENEADEANRYKIEAYVIMEPPAPPSATGTPSPIPPPVVAILGEAPADNLNSVLAQNGNSNVTIRFGHRNEEWYPESVGGVEPLCGEMEINIQDLSEPGAYYIQNAYIFNLILKDYWEDVAFDFTGDAENMVRRKLTMVNGRDPTLTSIEEYPDVAVTFLNTRTKIYIEEAVKEQVAKGKWDEDFSHYGWGGAAIWYNKIAQFNGSLISSVYNLPVPKKYPMIMEEVLERKKAQDNAIVGPERFNPVLTGGTKIFASGKKAEFADLFYEAQSVWTQTQSKDSDNFMGDAIKMLFGIEGLIDIHKNVDIHPLAQLVGIGRGLIESAVQNFGYSGISAFGGMVAKGALGTLSSNSYVFFKTVAMMGLSLGFVLYYILPLLPFIYFFVALTNWVKTIFEAMIGLPLWALAHIRIDGDGLPGPAAMNGYYLIFEIFINPILIVFGMLAGITIFSAQVYVLNDIWGLVVTNLTGHNVDALSKTVEDKTGSIRYLRGVFDQFFYTCMYTIFVYMIGMASFKLVDTIPDRILRWMGTSVKSFNETADSMASQLVGKSYQATQTATGNADGMMMQMMARNS